MKWRSIDCYYIARIIRKCIRICKLHDLFELKAPLQLIASETTTKKERSKRCMVSWFIVIQKAHFVSNTQKRTHTTVAHLHTHQRIELSDTHAGPDELRNPVEQKRKEIENKCACV